jgi:DNA-binding NarL/FixJ family response regulator
VLRQTSPERKLSRFPATELLVRARIAVGELDEANEAVDELRELERRVATPALRAHVALAAGMVTAAVGDHAQARPLLEDSVDTFEASGAAPYEAARARIELATSLVALDRGHEATQEAAAALESLLRLGAATDAARARRLLDASTTPPSADSSVTARERDVLGLLAEGLTNRQIAERLVVSEHTVHRHVTNILRKLDLPSRTAAAAHAVRAGLVEDPRA